MRRLVSILLVAALAISLYVTVTAQPSGMGMSMGAKTLLIAQLDAKQVVGGSSSNATATAAFILNSAEHSLSYRLTYQGLEAGAPKSIALYNFGREKNGERIATLCGAGAPACPKDRSATIAGEMQRAGGRALDNNLIGEFDSERIYVEIVGGNGKPEIRGQLAANGAMVRVANYVAELKALPGGQSRGTGTAIFSETFLPAGKVAVYYAATVAGTSGAPVSAALIAGAAGERPTFSRESALPNLKLRLSRDESSGGSFSGAYEVKSDSEGALLVERLTAGNRNVAMVVSTRRAPEGEVYGALVPVE
jgi:hypothetical protein